MGPYDGEVGWSPRVGVNRPGFWAGLKSIAEDEPIGCGIKKSSVFVVSCGEFLVIWGPVPVFWPNSCGVRRLELLSFCRKNVDKTWL
jgi:hypothetical protein